MNKANLLGRLTRDPEIRYSQGNDQMAIARYTLAVDRRFKRDGEQTADFINCVAFGKAAEFAEKYLKKGTKIAVTGRIQTNKDGWQYEVGALEIEKEFDGKRLEVTNISIKSVWDIYQRVLQDKNGKTYLINDVFIDMTKVTELEDGEVFPGKPFYNESGVKWNKGNGTCLCVCASECDGDHRRKYHRQKRRQ